MPPTGVITDPFNNFNFLVEIDGIARAAFQECSGFGSEIDITEYRQGGENTTMRKLPGLTKYNNITLKWGMTDSTELYDWYRDIIKGKVERKDGSIILQDTEGNEAIRWNFYNGWPTKWDGPGLDAKANDIAIQTLEIAHEGLERV